MKCGLFAMAMLAVALGGCSERALPKSDPVVRDIRRSLQILSTNASVRMIRATESAFTNLALVMERKQQMALVGEWERALMDINVSRLPPAGKYAVLREASDMLNSGVPSALRSVGSTYDEVWELHFRALSWLDAQVGAMKPKAVTDLDFQTLSGEWTCYQALAEWREVIVENHERFDFDERLYESGMERMEEIRNRFEKVIGRSVRPMSEIKSLGRFQKIVADQIAKQKADALGERCR